MFRSGDREAPDERSRFEISLDDINKHFDAATVSRMQILNLDSLIVRRDVDKAAIVEKADLLALATIEENLSEGDAFVHSAVGVYGFLFPGMAKSAAELKRQVIADQIARLVNSSEMTPANIDFELKAKRRHGGTASDVIDQDRKARIMGPAAARPRSLEERQQMERERKRAEQALASMARRLEPADKAASAGAGIPWGESRDAGRGEVDLPEGLTTVFRPVWNVKSKLLTAYAAEPVTKLPDGGVEMAIPMSSDDDNHAAKAALDDFVEREALDRLHLLLEAVHPVLLILPVHFATVDRHDCFAPYLQRMKGLPENKRKLLVLELIGTPRELPAGRIRGTVNRMRQVVRSVIVRVRPNEERLPHWKKADAHAVGFDCAEYPVPEKDLMKAYDRFTQRADKAGLRKFIYGLTTRSMATAAVAAGFEYIEGGIVRPAVDMPKYVEPFESRDLFAELLGR